MNTRTDRKNIIQKPIHKNTVVGQVMDRVKELIASGTYKPGDRLPTEQELAEMFQVGRSSIREALKVFHHLGVVESKAAKGTFIQDRANISLEAITWALVLGEDDMRDVYELREAIEFISFRHFIQDLGQKEPAALESLAKLREIIDHMREIAETGEVDQMVQADYSFHETIIEAGKNRLFVGMYHTLQAFLTNEILLTYLKINDLGAVAEDHAQMIDSLENQPTDMAMKRHWDHFDRILHLLGIAVPEEGGDVRAVHPKIVARTAKYDH